MAATEPPGDALDHDDRVTLAATLVRRTHDEDHDCEEFDPHLEDAKKVVCDTCGAVLWNNDSGIVRGN